MVFLCVSRPNKSKFRLRQVFRPKFVRFRATTIHFVRAETGLSLVRQVLAIFRKNIYVS